MKTKLEIINMVANHYNKKNRAKTDYGCRYITDDGRMCAVGICMTDGALEDFKHHFGGVQSIAKSITKSGMEGSIDVLLKDEYKGHDLWFWSELQYFHDDNNAWDENGMTKHGLSKYERLKNRYQ